jgi:hypothetical protein
MRELRALDTDQPFRTEGSTQKGLLLFYAETGYVYLTPRIFKDLAKDFAGQSVSIGPGPADQRPLGSLGAWLRDRGIIRDIAAPLAAVLVADGYASADGADHLLFARPSSG